MVRSSVAFILVLMSAIGLLAQEPETLVVSEFEINTAPDLFGSESTNIIGNMQNVGSEAFESIEIYADVFNSDNEVIGEGFGYLTDACGTALLDYVLFPGQEQEMLLIVELFSGGDISHVEFFPDGEISDALPDKRLATYNGVETITRDEVVAVQWLGSDALRYGVGCDEDVFTNLDWYSHDRLTGTTEAIAHPLAEFITEPMLEAAGLRQRSQGGEEDLFLFDRSRLAFPPSGGRIVYQNDLNTIFTAERNGSFRRIVQGEMSSYTLQGFDFTPDGEFLAYYFGAYGEPVRWMVGNMDGQLLSDTINQIIPSVTVPGITNDAAFVIIGGTFNDVTGYYLKTPRFASNELLVAVDELPGNNYPPPAYSIKAPGTSYLYFVQQGDADAELFCFHREANQLHSLTHLPLELSNNERAWMQLSPDGNALSLSANGSNGGLWLIDLTTYDVCQ